MSRTMRYLTALFLGFWFIGFLQACKKEDEVDPGFGPNGEPRILAVHISDIPDQNISINQDTKQIQVTVPTSFSASSIKPTYQLTPSTFVKSTGESYIFPSSGSTNVGVMLSTQTNVTNAYQYVFKPAGDLYFAKTDTPISYTVTQDDGNNGGTNAVCFLVYNYIDSVGASTLLLTNSQTGKQLVFNQAGSRYCETAQYRDGAVAVRALFDRRTYYQPGNYRVELVKSSGRRTTLSQPFQLQRGIPTLYLGDNYNHPFVINGPSYKLPGANILQGDKLTLRLQSRTQSAVTVQPTGLLADQPGVQLPSLTGLSPGYYYAQLILNGVELPSYIRLMLVANADDLAIGYVLNVDQSGQHQLLNPAVSLDVPLTFSYGNYYQVLTNKPLTSVVAEKEVPRVRLTSQTDPGKEYYVFPNIAPAATSLQDYGTFKIPPTIPPGRYQLTYQLVLPDQSIISTPPLERDIVVE